MDQVIWPTVRGMAEEGNVYTGFLYAGLMIDKAGNPKVIEFNCRFGDPETQPVMLRLESSLVLLIEAAFAKRWTRSKPSGTHVRAWALCWLLAVTRATTPRAT